MSQPDDIRYGVFLMPDAKTSAAVASITGFVRAQFGLVSAKRFPPHVTLAGSLADRRRRGGFARGGRLAWLGGTSRSRSGTAVSVVSAMPRLSSTFIVLPRESRTQR
jgi:hypothetical protein